MTVEWIEPIYDRTYGDVLQASTDRDIQNPKGCYNYQDLNRIENNTKYCMEYMIEHSIIKTPPSLAIKTNWVQTDIPTRESMIRIIQNIQLLMDLSNPIIQEDFDIIYESTQFTYSLANAIEKNLYIMSTQPELPIQKWLLKIVNGIIVETNTDTAYLAEDETVNIQAVPFGDDAPYMIFTNWSGDANDLQYVGDVNAQTTTYTMQYHDTESYSVELTANFQTRFPRTLTLHGATIYDDIGGSTRQFYAGDEILILANDADVGKVFYEWQGTEEGLRNLTGGTEPSTSLLTMPDCDVELTSFYINAGQHSVTIDGEIYGWYDYDDYVYMYPNSKGEKWTFAYWSGDTGYLDEVTSSSFKMPDVDVSFTSNWTYNYSYNTVIVISGNINGESKQENLQETSGQSIVADEPKEGYIFDTWEIEGVGSFENKNSASTIFYVGDGNAVLIAKYVLAHTVTLENVNNSGQNYTMKVGENRKYSIVSQELFDNYIFDYWNKNGNKYGTSYFYEDIIMGNEDVTYTAVYRDRLSHTLTVNSGSGSGTYKEKQSVHIIADDLGKDFGFKRWIGNYESITDAFDADTYIVMPNEDCTITAQYDGRTYYNLTVNNGSGSGIYFAGQYVVCRGNQAPDGYEFSHWEENGEIVSYYNPLMFFMPDNDRELTAIYTEIPYFNLTVISGSGSGRYIRNSKPTITMNPAPTGMKFLQWEVEVGTEDDIHEPTASTTYISNLTHDTTVYATYYIPNPEILYTLTIIKKDGSSVIYNNPAGEQVEIRADSPDEGWEFYKWTGDTQYVNDKYSSVAVVNMPEKNITLEMEYRLEGYVTTYHVKLFGGEVLIETRDDGTQVWEIEGEFEEGSIVPIRAIDIPNGWRFNGWKDTDGKSASTVADLTQPETTIRVEDFDIELTRDVIEKDKYELSIINGEVSGAYYDGDQVSVYFNLENTETTHYVFDRWSGNDLAYIKLFDGGSFDIFNPGTPDYPQVIRMPDRNITITGTYSAEYRLLVNSIEQGYFTSGTQINISAEEISGKRFVYWSGDISYVDNRYNPNIVVTMPSGPVTLIPIYHNLNENNSIGYTLTDLYNSDNIDIDSINVISGEIINGFMITDINGHIYVVTDIIDNTCNIMRLTQIQGGVTNGQ